MKKVYIFLIACFLISTSNAIADEGDIQSSSSNNNNISSSSLEEIVVTARKREESLLDIP